MIAEKLPDDETSTNHSTFMYSPQLKEVGELPLVRWESCYEQTLDIVKDLYQKCKLVHADLSEYNLILQNKEIVYALVSSCGDVIVFYAIVIDVCRAYFLILRTLVKP